MILGAGRDLYLRLKLWALFALLSLSPAVTGCGGGGGDLCSGPLCVPPPPEIPQPAHLRAGTGNGQQGAPGRELPLPLEVIVTDDQNNPAPGVAVSFAVGGGGGSLSSNTAKSDNQGRAQVNWTLGGEVGTQTVEAAATDTSGAPLEGSPVALSAEAVRPAAASVLILTAPKDTAQSGLPLDQQPVLQVLDADGHPLSQVEVTASIATGGATLSGTTQATSDADGHVAYSDLTLAGTKGTNSIRFAAGPGVEVSTGPIELIAGTPALLSGVGPLTLQGTVSSPVSPAPSVLVTDAAGNGVAGVAVSFSVSRDGSVSPETATTNNDGVAQVSWTLGRTANVQYTLTARIESTTLTPVRYTATALPGGAGRLRVAVQPSSPTQNGSAFTQQPEIQVLDQNGNPTPQAGLVITATVSSGPTGSLQNGGATTNAQGRAVFSGLTLTGAVGNYTISFSAPGVTGVNSLPTTITVGPAARLSFSTLPSTAARSRAPLVIQPVLQVQDQSGNPVAQAGTPVLATTAADRTTLSGETVTTDGNGRAVFTSLTITGPPGPKPLSFSAAPLQSASATVRLPTVQTVTVSSNHPVSVVAGSPGLPNPVSWMLRDNSDRPVPDADFTLSASPGGTLSPPSTTSDINGVVQLESWTPSPTAGDQYVELKLPDGRMFRDSILVTPGAAATLVKVSGDNQTAPVNSQLPKPFLVQVVDQFGNGVGDIGVQWAICDGALGDVVPTDVLGFSSIPQTTPAQASGETFCTSATVAALNGARVDFHYQVTGASTSPTEVSAQ